MIVTYLAQLLETMNIKSVFGTDLVIGVRYKFFFFFGISSHSEAFALAEVRH